MAKSELTAVVEPKCQRLADELGYELVDVALDKEDSGKYLRIYIDKPDGVDLNDCEKYHPMALFANLLFPRKIPSDFVIFPEKVLDNGGGVWYHVFVR